MSRFPILLLLIAFPASGAEVLRVGRDHQNIAVTHPEPKRWEVDDRICIYHGKTRVICGNIFKVTPKGAIAKLEASNADVLAGDEVRGAGSRRPTALLGTS